MRDLFEVGTRVVTPMGHREASGTIIKVDPEYGYEVEYDDGQIFWNDFADCRKE